MTIFEITIKETILEEALHVSRLIPEFENPYSEDDYKERLKDKKSLILTAYIKSRPIGFKIGYETISNENFYSWMGGVLPRYRNTGIADKLIKFQEDWVREKGFKRIIVKTRNKHQAMIRFLEKHGYYKMAAIPHDPDYESRIIYEKKL